MVTSPIYKEVKAQNITTLGAQMRMDYQGTRLTGNNSLNPVMTHFIQPNYPEGKTINNQNWFVPIIAFASIAILFVSVAKK
jgi:hypothetical protein